MKKKFLLLFIITICVIMTIGLCACGDKAEENNEPNQNQNTQVQLLQFEGLTFSGQTVEYDGKTHSIVLDNEPEGATVRYTNNTGKDVGTYSATAVVSKEGYETKTLNATLKINLPTAKTIVAARESATNSNTQNYDFTLNLTGTVSLMGYSGSASANYDGKYRYNATTGDTKFFRQTSGMLLYDANEYIETRGNTKIKINATTDNVVKHVNVLNTEKEGLTLINKPFEAIVNALKENYLSNIRLATDNPQYMFATNINISSENVILSKLLNIVSKQGTSISFKDVSFTNPVSGVVLYFNLDERMQLDSYSLSAAISVPVKGVSISISISYKQMASNSAINIPAVGGLIIEKDDITTELATINSAFNAVKNSNAYSLDFTAKNEFDPGWNKNAIVDKYIARMYKNTYELDSVPFTAFNHSFEYKAHTEEEGAETFKYTIGNIDEDGSVHLVSRKGSNTITPLDAVTADTRFNYLTNAFAYTANDIDCIEKTTKNGVTTYKVYLTEAETTAVNQKILEIVNSNDADGVLDVDNYFDSTDYNVKESCFTLDVANNMVKNVSIETKIKYTPTDGDYTDRVITLENEIVLEVNKNLDKATDYTAPKSTNTTLLKVGLNNAKYYIL